MCPKLPFWTLSCYSLSWLELGQGLHGLTLPGRPGLSPALSPAGPLSTVPSQAQGPAAARPLEMASRESAALRRRVSAPLGVRPPAPRERWLLGWVRRESCSLLQSPAAQDQEPLPREHLVKDQEPESRAWAWQAPRAPSSLAQDASHWKRQRRQVGLRAGPRRAGAAGPSRSVWAGGRRPSAGWLAVHMSSEHLVHHHKPQSLPCCFRHRLEPT